MRRTAVAVALALGLAACGDDDEVSPRATAPGTTVTLANYTIPPFTTPPTTAAPTEYALGTELTGEPSGRKVTVFTFEPWTPTNQFSKAKPGFSFYAIDVKGCAGSETDQFGFNPFEFELAMPDATRIDASFSAKEPRLSSGPLAASDCIRGWVTYEVPTGQRPEFVIYSSSGALAKWRIPAG